MKNGAAQAGKPPSQLIDERVRGLGDWRGEMLGRRRAPLREAAPAEVEEGTGRGEMLGRLRALIREADPEVVEEWKWRGVPVWSHDGIICTGETYKAVVKMTFAKGAALSDPSNLFNSSLDGNTRRAIDVREGET